MKVLSKCFSLEGLKQDPLWERVKEFCPDIEAQISQVHKNDAERRERIKQIDDHLASLREKGKRLEESLQKKVSENNAKYDKLQKGIGIGLAAGAIALPTGIIMYKHYKNKQKKKRKRD